MLNNRWFAGLCIAGMFFCDLPVAWAALPGAHSSTVSGNVFLGGNYIEVGIHSIGSFGTSVDKPEGFYGTSGSNKIGLSSDNDGFGNGYDLRIDYFLPGTPEERWVVGYNGTVTASNAGLNGASGIPITSALTNTSAGDTLSAELTGTLNSILQIRQQIRFGVNDKFFANTVTLKNVSASPITSVRYMRSFDPDNTVFKGGGYSTTNEVTKTIAEDGKAVVVAQTPTAQSLAGETAARYPILFFSKYAGAVGSTFGFANGDPYAASAYSSPRAKNSPIDADQAITMDFDVGTLAPDASVSFTYYTSLDSQDPDTVIEEIEQADSSSSSSASSSTSTESAASTSTPAGGHRGHGTLLQMALEVNRQSLLPDAHPAASSSSSSVAVSQNPAPSTPVIPEAPATDYQVIVPHVHVVGAGVLTKGTPVDVIRFLSSGRMAQIKLANGRKGLILSSAIGKK